MKTLLVVLAVICSASAIPQDARQARFVDGIIAGVIEDLTESIVQAGLDPYHLNEAGLAYELPVPVIFNAKAHVKNLQLNGISNIIINYINWSIIRLRVDLDINLPQIYFAVDEAAVEASFFGKNVSASIRGSVRITKPRVSGWMTFSLLGGISLNNINLEFNLEKIFSLLDVSLMGQNFAAPINALVTHKIPATLREFSTEINQLITIIAGDVIKKELSR